MRHPANIKDHRLTKNMQENPLFTSLNAASPHCIPVDRDATGRPRQCIDDRGFFYGIKAAVVKILRPPFFTNLLGVFRFGQGTGQRGLILRFATLFSHRLLDPKVGPGILSHKFDDQRVTVIPSECLPTTSLALLVEWTQEKLAVLRF